MEASIRRSEAALAELEASVTRVEAQASKHSNATEGGGAMAPTAAATGGVAASMRRSDSSASLLDTLDRLQPSPEREAAAEAMHKVEVRLAALQAATDDFGAEEAGWEDEVCV